MKKNIRLKKVLLPLKHFRNKNYPIALNKDKQMAILNSSDKKEKPSSNEIDNKFDSIFFTA